MSMSLIRTGWVRRRANRLVVDITYIINEKSSLGERKCFLSNRLGNGKRRGNRLGVTLIFGLIGIRTFPENVLGTVKKKTNFRIQILMTFL